VDIASLWTCLSVIKLWQSVDINFCRRLLLLEVVLGILNEWMDQLNYAIILEKSYLCSSRQREIKPSYSCNMQEISFLLLFIDHNMIISKCSGGGSYWNYRVWNSIPVYVHMTVRPFCTKPFLTKTLKKILSSAMLCDVGREALFKLYKIYEKYMTKHQVKFRLFVLRTTV